MKQIYIMILMLPMLSANAQTGFSWVRHGEAAHSAYMSEVAVDAQGYVYTGGIFYNPSLSFGSQTLSTTGSNPFLCKYDLQGNLIWVKTSDNNAYAGFNSITTDSSGNVYVSGDFRQTLTIDGITLTNGIQGHIAMFVAKFSSDGNIIWAKKITGNDESVYPRKMVIDSNNNIYISGGFESTELNFGTMTLTGSNGYRDLFLIKCDSAGNPLWGKTLDGNAYSNDVASIAVDNSGSVYIGGSYEDGSLTIETTILANSGGRDIYLAKFDSAGLLQWTQRFGNSGHEIITNLEIDNENNIIITGNFGSTITFGSIILTSTGANTNNIFVGKLNPIGETLWMKNYGAVSGIETISLAIDNSNNIYLGGYTSSTSTNFENQILANEGLFNSFILKFNEQGHLTWSRFIGGNGSNILSGMAVENSNVFVSGTYSGNVKFDTLQLNAVNTYNPFIAKIADETAGISSFQPVLKIYPVPAYDILYIDEMFKDKAYEIYDFTGKKVSFGIVMDVINVSALPSGLYSLKIDSSSTKFIKE